MKLLAITNRYYFISITVFFVLAGIVLFYSIKYQLTEELNEQLKTEQVNVTRIIEKSDSLNMTFLLNDNMSFRQAGPEISFKPVLFDTLKFDNVEKENIPYRIIRFPAKSRYQNYVITIQSSKIENEDIILSIFLSLIIVFALFSIMLYLSNYYFSKKLWSPFLKTIATIKSVNIHDSEAQFAIDKTNVQEFYELNSSLQQMIDRIKRDYRRMKDFSENASHELQTPLSIIRSKLESLLQSPDLKAREAQLIDQALESTVRLSRINQTLLLLTKIENGQFVQKQDVSFYEVFEKYLEAYREMIIDKKLKIKVEREGDFSFAIHPALADVLVSNILNNAIKHNIDNGWLTIKIHPEGLDIRNSGLPPEYPPEQLFNRFAKGTHSAEHLGLGLALIKEIAQSYDFEVQYNYHKNMHIFIINAFVKAI